jgi:peptidyl-prolyl cis-trans isomerase D
MFDTVRKHNKIFMAVLFLLIVPSFVLFGLEGYSRFNEKGESVATVNRESITQSAWDQFHRLEVERIQRQRPNINVKLLDTPQAKYASLELLVRDRVLATAALKSHLLVSDQRVAAELQQDEVIRTLIKPDGRLDMERYKQILADQGTTPEMFEARIRQDMLKQQVLGGVLQSNITGNAAPEKAIGAYFQRRVVQVALFEPAQFSAKQEVTEEQVQAYYQGHMKAFQVPEQADVEYIVLDLDAAMKQVSISEAELRAFYEQNAARLNTNEERRARHILINAPKDSPAAEQQQAKARAEQLRAALAKTPDTFAQVARKESQDPGSASNGGDLDYFKRGAMTKAFEEAVFAMKKGEISAVVQTEFGYHIIQLTDIKGAGTPSFAQVRTQIEEQAKKQQAQKKFAELAEQFSNGVYEQADSLKPVAERLKLDIKTAQHVTRNPAPDAKGALANPKFLASLFSADAVQSKRNTASVEIAPSTLVAGRISKYAPARTLELAEVKDKVKAMALLDKAAQVARAQGQEKLQALKTDAQAVKFAEAVSIARMDRKGLPGEVVLAALRAETKALPSYTGVDLGDRGYAIVKLNQVQEVPADQKQSATSQAKAQYSQWWLSAEGMAYYDTLKQRYKADIKVAKPAADAIESGRASN